jgi:hypothetical protein
MTALTETKQEASNIQNDTRRRGGLVMILKNFLEPTIGLEPMTCRLRNGSTLRMLLVNMGD